MDKLGEIHKTANGFEWEIPHFLSLPEDEGRSYSSPSISFNEESWCLQIYPNGCYRTIEYINLCVVRISTGSPISIEVSLALKTANGKKDAERCCTAVFDDFHCFHASSRFISRSELRRREVEFVPLGVLTVMCTLKILKSTESANFKSLCQDYKKVLLEGNNHDVIFKVGSKELRAHRDILKARSHVFESMLSHDMSEKKSGVIEVEDCDPEAMEQFLLHIYCGKVEKLDQSNMLQLYYIADKYEMEDLKKESTDFIQKSLSPTNICEVIQFAINHSDSNLHDFARNYFIENVSRILCTAQWESFIKDNFSVANELLIKSHENKK